MILSDWFGTGFDILQAPLVPFGFIHYLYYRFVVESKDKMLREQRESSAQMQAMGGGRGRRAT